MLNVITFCVAVLHILHTDVSAFIVLKETTAVPKFRMNLFKWARSNKNSTWEHYNWFWYCTHCGPASFFKLGLFARIFVLLRLIIPAFMNKPFDRIICGAFLFHTDLFTHKTGLGSEVKRTRWSPTFLTQQAATLKGWRFI